MSRSLQPFCIRLLRENPLSAGCAAHDCGEVGFGYRYNLLLIDAGSGLLIPKPILAGDYRGRTNAKSRV